jgi:hypothetical protein
MGDKSVQPNYTLGLRARLTSLAILVTFIFIVFLMYGYDDVSFQSNKLIFNNPVCSNILALVLGVILSNINFNYKNKKFINPEDEVHTYTQ